METDLEIIHYFDATSLSQTPLDKFTNEEIAHFRAKDPHNFVWAILGDTLENHSYHQEAARTLRAWAGDGTLVRESEDKFLVYRQKYESP
jgi:hypothetical protein